MFPLIKDTIKSTCDKNDIRPIFVSDPLTNIFEKVFLHLTDKRYEGNKKRFGFKSKNSCSHAIFILNETIKLTKYKRKKIYITAIDASKAFDKVNRNFLWLIIYEKLK